MIFVTLLALISFRTALADDGEMTVDCTTVDNSVQPTCSCIYERQLARGRGEYARCYTNGEKVIRIRCHLHGTRKKEKAKNEAVECVFVTKQTDLDTEMRSLAPGTFHVETDDKLFECNPRAPDKKESLTAKYTDLSGLKPEERMAARDKAVKKGLNEDQFWV